MRNTTLAKDYVRRASFRLRLVDVAYEAHSWADAIRESQELVELALRGLLRASGIDPPRTHDVSATLLSEKSRLPAAVRPKLERLADISRDLRRDRELAFYGAEDLVPSEFYTESDAKQARDAARFVVAAVSSVVAVEGG
jgi:hypothetical protein